MNIIKVKDTYLTDEFLQLTEEQRKIFNEKFRDHYVNVINWTYCIPIEQLSNLSEIIKLSQTLCKHIDGDETIETIDSLSVQPVSMELYDDTPLLRSVSDAAGTGDFTLCTDFTSIKNNVSNYEFVITTIYKNSTKVMCSAYKPNDTSGTYFTKQDIQDYTYSEPQATLSESVLPADTIVFNIEKFGTEDTFVLTHKHGDELHHIGGNSKQGKNTIYCGTAEEVTNFEFRWDISNVNSYYVNIIPHSYSRYLVYNNSATRFSCYDSVASYTYPALYYRPIQKVKVDPDIYFKEYSVTVPLETEQYLNEMGGAQAYMNGEYFSSDEDIATVDKNGFVTFKTGGSVVISFVTEETDLFNSIEIDYTLNISTTDPGLYWANENIKDNKYTVADGIQYESVAASIYKDYDGIITYESYDESVATIDENGNVITHSSGETYIVANCSGSKKYDDTSIDYLLTVTYNPLKQYDWFLYQTLIDLNLIDIETSEKINNLDKFIEFNKFSYTDSELTFDDVRVFRTWLGKTLYNILSHEEDNDVLEMLNYYALNMNDCTVQHLNLFNINQSTDIISNITKSGCGCQKADVMQTDLTVCDPISIYRKSIYEKMVSVLGNIDFWLQREDDLLKEIKKYVDYIIIKNLPLTATERVSNLYDCTCLTDADIEQESLMKIMKNLSISLGYLIDNDFYSHKNFISESFNFWASVLYEKMIW